MKSHRLPCECFRCKGEVRPELAKPGTVTVPCRNRMKDIIATIENQRDAYLAGAYAAAFRHKNGWPTLWRYMMDYNKLQFTKDAHAGYLEAGGCISTLKTDSRAVLTRHLRRPQRKANRRIPVDLFEWADIRERK